MRLVPVKYIKNNDILGRTLYDTEGRILLKKGVSLSDNLLKRIINIGIKSIYISDEYSSSEVEDVVKQEVRVKAVKIIKDTFHDISKYSDIINPNTNNTNKTAPKKMLDQSFETIESVSKMLVDEILLNKNILVNLIDIKTVDNYTYEHCVNVAILSLVLGIDLGLNIKQLHTLCIGALLHDNGKVFVPKDLLLKPAKLTPYEYSLVQEHTTLGYEYLKESLNIPTVAKLIILQHHEKIDGTGYPRQINASRIHRFSKIVSIADVYDALTSHRPYRDPLSPSEAIEYVMGGAGTHFDLKMSRQFVRKIVPYPIGTLVKLSNGEIGVIEDINQNYPLRPKVKIIRHTVRNKMELIPIDLLEVNNLVIEGLYHDYNRISKTYIS